MRIAFVLLAFLVVSGCSFHRGEKPEVSLVDVVFSDLTLFETTARFKVRVTNPNNFPLTLEGGRHDIYLNNIHLGKGTSDSVVEIPRFGSATDEVLVHISNFSIISRIQSLINSTTLDYRVDSDIFVKGGFLGSTYHVSQSGSIPVGNDRRSF